ncbi:hypothetical protein KJ854_02535 [Patescibacteria group bacterium]|nr:hypothetical protein [Patescibacteria group bacterium]
MSERIYKMEGEDTTNFDGIKATHEVAEAIKEREKELQNEVNEALSKGLDDIIETLETFEEEAEDADWGERKERIEQMIEKVISFKVELLGDNESERKREEREQEKYLAKIDSMGRDA